MGAKWIGIRGARPPEIFTVAPAIAACVRDPVRDLDKAYYMILAGPKAARMVRSPVARWETLYQRMRDTLNQAVVDHADTLSDDLNGPVDMDAANAELDRLCQRAVLAAASFLSAEVHALGEQDPPLLEIDAQDALRERLDELTAGAVSTSRRLLRHVEDGSWQELVSEYETHEQLGNRPANVHHLFDEERRDIPTCSALPSLAPTALTQLGNRCGARLDSMRLMGERINSWGDPIVVKLAHEEYRPRSGILTSGPAFTPGQQFPITRHTLLLISFKFHLDPAAGELVGSLGDQFGRYQEPVATAAGEDEAGWIAADWDEPGSAEGDGDGTDVPSWVRPYTWTAGRTSTGYDLAVETLLSTSERGVRLLAFESPRFEHRVVADLCGRPRSVAEVAAMLSMPLGVARVLLGDMAALGIVTVHATASAADGEPDLALMERVLSGLRQL